jgi:LETM1 and EF-hand domain-containing protein 1
MSIWIPRHAPLLAVAHVGRVAGTRPLFVLDALHYAHPRRASAMMPRTPISRRLASTNASTSGEPPAPKDIAEPKEPMGTRVWKKVKHEVQHYWHGSKLLVSEVRIASRLQLKILRGGSLTRRERRQVRSRHIAFDI